MADTIFAGEFTLYHFRVRTPDDGTNDTILRIPDEVRRTLLTLLGDHSLNSLMGHGLTREECDHIDEMLASLR